MPLLELDALPRDTTKGTVVRLLIQLGGIDKHKIGAIELSGRRATISVPEAWVARLVKALDGASLGTSRIRAALRGDHPGDSDSAPSEWPLAAPAGAATREAAAHFARLTRLLAIESDAEAEQLLAQARKFQGAEAERTGNSLVGMVVRDVAPGLGGRFLLTLFKRDATQPLPWTRLGAGSPVLLSRQDERGESWRGVVSERGQKSIEIALAALPEFDDGDLLRLDAAADEVARDRQRAALQRVAGASGDRLAQLRAVLLGERAPRFLDAPPEVNFRGSALNASQQDAVRHALRAADVALIHGPPGTGKTTTVAEVIRQAVARGDRVLACAPSNLGVDNILEKLLGLNVNAVRLGHPARVLPGLREHTLDLLVDAHPDVQLARRWLKEAAQLRARAGRFTRSKPPPGAKREMRAEAAALVADARQTEMAVVEQLLNGADVLCTTLTGIDSELLGQRQFDLAVLDEAGQSTEPACWIPLLRSQRVILAGDPCQLPPTIVSPEAAAQGFGVSLLERLMKSDPRLSRRLEVQYRMHADIMHFPSAEFYEGSLRADPSVAAHLLADLPDLLPGELTTQPLLFIDTAGAGYDEEQEPDGESRLNRGEAALVVRLVRQLLAAGLSPEQLAVIAPYAAQARLLRAELRGAAGLEIDSVDGFQGREKEAVIISFVRANPAGEIGFLADTRRTNVALTRARRKLIVIGDSATLGGHPFYRRLLEYFEARGAYRSVWEFQDET